MILITQLYHHFCKEDGNKAFDFKSFSTPVINTLAQLVKAEFTGRNDLEIDGKNSCSVCEAAHENESKTRCA